MSMTARKMERSFERIRVIDTHTGGEPTRVVLEGGPDLGKGSFLERRRKLREEFDGFRSAVVDEPRGSDVIVGALICEPAQPECTLGVIFFNNIGPIGMCGHGTIGLAVALAHEGRIEPGVHRLETPVGIVTFELHDDETVTLENVASFRHAKSVSIDVPGYGPCTGDVAWGGNWFFLISDHGQELSRSRANELRDYCLAVRLALEHNDVTGAEGAEIDHVELFGPSNTPDVDGRGFVLCPGGAWDRSPCGTGTSAKLACLAADGKLAPGELWRQESIIGSVFEARYHLDVYQRVVPSIKGSAWVTAKSTLLLDSRDPLAKGLPA